jgi:hypothetical protein
VEETIQERCPELLEDPFQEPPEGPGPAAPSSDDTT